MQRIGFLVPPRNATSVVADFAGGLGFEPLDEFVLPPLDLMQLAANLGPNTEAVLLDALANDWTRPQAVSAVETGEIDQLVTLVSLPSVKADLEIIELVRPHVRRSIVRLRSTDSDVLKSILSRVAVDLCVHGECDDNFGGIVDGTDMRGTARMVEGSLEVVPKDPILDLDGLPTPLRSLERREIYSFPKLGITTTVLTSRGCPYPCGYYCPYPMVQGRKWRARSVANVLEELASLEADGHTTVLFRDAVFTLNLGRVREICEGLIASKSKLRWWCETRADRLDDQLIENMAGAGCVGINVGVESGDPNLRFSMLKRGVTDDVLVGVTSAARRAGIKVAFLMMVGFPGETRTSIYQSAQVISECRPDHVGIGFPVNHPGTKFHDDAVDNGWIISDDASRQNGSIPIVVSGLSAEDMISGRRQLVEFHEALIRDDSAAMAQLEAIRVWAGAGMERGASQ